MEQVFDACVALLLWLAAITGLTYKQVNVIWFCILWPILTAYHCLRIWWLRRAVNRNQAEIDRVVAEGAHDRIEALIAQTKQSCQEEIDSVGRKAREDAWKAKEEGFDKGLADGRKKGRAEGKAEATQAGKDAAYFKMAQELGLVDAGEAAPDVPADWQLRWGPHPNIYRSRAAWTVRVLAAGNRLTKEFRFTVDRRQVQGRQPFARRGYEMVVDEASCRAALIDALKWRNQYIDMQVNHQHLFAEVYDAVLGAQPPPNPFNYNNVREIAETFHTRLLSTELTIDDVGFFGEDPEDRLEIEDPSILLQPWSALFDTKPPKKFIDAFAHVGLGAWNIQSGARTIRDLLLVTGPELRQSSGFGQVALDQLREGLRNHGLALWGDDVPAPPAPIHRGRNLRSIELD